MIEKLRLLFKGSTASTSIPLSGEGGRLEVGDRGLTGTKRPSQKELCTGKRVKVRQPDSNDVVDL